MTNENAANAANAGAMEQVIAFLGRNFPDEAAGLSGLRKWVDGLGEGLGTPAIEPVEAAIAGVHSLRFEPAGASADMAILYLHGGAFIAGSALSHGPLVASLAKEAGITAILPEYRLAPEYPFPAALEDARAVYLELVNSGRKVALAGDSAGGGLAVTLTLDLLARGMAAPTCLSLISPWVDMTLSGASMTARADLDPMITQEALEAGIAAYSGALPPEDPRLSPLFAELAGLPPVQVQVGERERVFNDATRFVERGRSAGVDVTFREWAGMVHVWPLFGRWLPEGPQAITDIARFMRHHTA